MRLFILATLFLTTACQAAPAVRPIDAALLQVGASAVKAPGVTGDLRKHAGVSSRFLSAKRDVWVWLPAGYAQASAARFPVLYMHDGNNLFDPAIAFGGHEWQVDESMTKLVKAGDVPPMIVVGVGNSPDRMEEYTWVTGKAGGKAAGGQGAAYAKFLTTELKPFIDKSYRTKTGRADTGVMGSSLGGLESAYLGIHNADTFGKIGVMSPSVWWSDRAVVKDTAKLPTGLRIWLDFGRNEGDEPQAAYAEAEQLRSAVLARGYKQGQTFTWHEDPLGGHNEAAWSYRFPLAVTWLFGSQASR